MAIRLLSPIWLVFYLFSCSIRVMAYIVTGGAGFIGSNLVERLVREEKKVIVVDNLHTGSRENLRTILDTVGFHEMDSLDIGKIKEKNRSEEHTSELHSQ